MPRFRETFHDTGKTDMAACIRAYREIGFTGPARPDHVPTLEGESNELAGYHMQGRLFAVGYAPLPFPSKPDARARESGLISR